MAKAYLVVELDFAVPVPFMRQACIFNRDPQKQGRPYYDRRWATIMTTEGRDFAEARRQMMEKIEFLGHRDPSMAKIRRFLFGEVDLDTHAANYGVHEAIDKFVRSMGTPNHPFFIGSQSNDQGPSAA